MFQCTLGSLKHLVQIRHEEIRKSAPVKAKVDFGPSKAYAIRYIKKIPDSTIESSCKRLMAIIGDLQKSEKKTMVRSAEKYSPFTRALLGALMESSGNEPMTGNLKKSLNPITSYKISGIDKILSSSGNWNIK